MQIILARSFSLFGIGQLHYFCYNSLKWFSYQYGKFSAFASQTILTFFKYLNAFMGFKHHLQLLLNCAFFAESFSTLLIQNFIINRSRCWTFEGHQKVLLSCQRTFLSSPSFSLCWRAILFFSLFFLSLRKVPSKFGPFGNFVPSVVPLFSCSLFLFSFFHFILFLFSILIFVIYLFAIRIYLGAM